MLNRGEIRGISHVMAHFGPGHVVPTLPLRKLLGNPEAVLWGAFDHRPWKCVHGGVVRTSYRACSSEERRDRRNEHSSRKHMSPFFWYVIQKYSTMM